MQYSFSLSLSILTKSIHRICYIWFMVIPACERSPFLVSRPIDEFASFYLFFLYFKGHIGAGSGREESRIFMFQSLVAEKTPVGSHPTHQQFLVLESSLWCLGQDTNCSGPQSTSFSSSSLDAFPGPCSFEDVVSMLPLVPPTIKFTVPAFFCADPFNIRQLRTKILCATPGARCLGYNMNTYPQVHSLVWRKGGIISCLETV